MQHNFARNYRATSIIYQQPRYKDTTSFHFSGVLQFFWDIESENSERASTNQLLAFQAASQRSEGGKNSQIPRKIYRHIYRDPCCSHFKMGAKSMMETQDENFNLREKIDHDRKENVDMELQKKFCRNVLYGTFGFVFLSSGITLLISFSAILEHFVKKNIVITPDSYILNYWKEPPVPIYVKFYFFNITNHEDFPWNAVKPHLQEVGPYTYREYRKRVDVNWHENQTVSYRQLIHYAFEPKLSIGPENDSIYTVNLPLVAAIDAAKSNFILKWGLTSALKMMQAQFVTRRTVGQLLLVGFKDPLVKIAHLVGQIPIGRFGYLIDKNGTDFEYLAHTGVGNSEKVMELEKWKGKGLWEWWSEKSCNLFSGTDGTLFSPYSPKDRKLQIFVPEGCRTFEMEYSGPSDTLGVPTSRYKFANDTFSNGNGSFEKPCNCNSKLCRTPGLYNMSHCIFGAPIFASFPHFYKSDPAFVDQFDGLHPNQQDHDTFLDVEPISGAPVNMSVRLQLNVYVENTHFTSLKPMMFPLLMGMKVAEIDEHLADLFLWITHRSYFYSKLLSATMIAVGMILLTFVVICRLISHDVKWLKVEQIPPGLLSTR